jgi:hypothetical protein
MALGGELVVGVDLGDGPLKRAAGVRLVTGASARPSVTPSAVASAKVPRSTQGT